MDDVHASLATMSALGRAITSEPIEAIRDAVLDYAARRKWFVVRHSTYVEWASTMIGTADQTWLVLDPLFPISDYGDRVRRIRLTRQFDNNEPIVQREYLLTNPSDPAAMPSTLNNVGVVDDAAASGSTLRRVSRLVVDAGGHLEKVILCASSREARDRFHAHVRGAQWDELFRGDWHTIHLRDGCPHLPYSGRPTRQPAVLGDDSTPVEIRVASSAVLGNYWQILCMDKKIRHVTAFAHGEIARRLSVHLGRPACVRDLALLGYFVPAIIAPPEVVTAETTLDSLVNSATPR
jgi:hypothetical protein